MHAMPRGEERQRAVGSKSDGGVPIRVSQPGQAAGFGPAWHRSDAPACFHFFQKVDFHFLEIPARLKKFIEIVWYIQIY
jgi:hypothetical protein